MSVEFTEENDFKVNIKSLNKKGLIGLLINKGIVKTEKGAQYILLAVIIICFGISGLILFNQNAPASKSEPLSEEEIQNLPPPLQEIYRRDNRN